MVDRRIRQLELLRDLVDARRWTVLLVRVGADVQHNLIPAGQLARSPARFLHATAMLTPRLGSRLMTGPYSSSASAPVDACRRAMR